MKLSFPQDTASQLRIGLDSDGKSNTLWRTAMTKEQDQMVGCYDRYALSGFVWFVYVPFA